MRIIFAHVDLSFGPDKLYHFVHTNVLLRGNVAPEDIHAWVDIYPHQPLSNFFVYKTFAMIFADAKRFLEELQ